MTDWLAMAMVQRAASVIQGAPEVLGASSARVHQTMAVLDELLGRPMAVRAVMLAPAILAAAAPAMWEVRRVYPQPPPPSRPPRAH
jgi:hypothetical protein